MPGLTNATSAQALDLLFPATGATDHIAYSTNGSSEWSGLARTPVGATGWGSATVADPAVKANDETITSAAASAAGTVTHAAIFTALAGGTQRTDWTALATSRTLGIGDTISWAPDEVRVTLT
jgi:hypothetical protein